MKELVQEKMGELDELNQLHENKDLSEDGNFENSERSQNRKYFCENKEINHISDEHLSGGENAENIF